MSQYLDKDFQHFFKYYCLSNGCWSGGWESNPYTRMLETSAFEHNTNTHALLTSLMVKLKLNTDD